MPGSYWFRFVEGEDFTRSLTYFAADGITPIDLTNYHAELDIDLNATTTIITVTDGHGITLGGIAGTIQVKIPVATFAAASFFVNARYRLILTDGTGNKIALLYGQISKEGQT